MRTAVKLLLAIVMFGVVVAPTQSNAVDWATCNIADFSYYQWTISAQNGSANVPLDVSRGKSEQIQTFGSQANAPTCREFNQQGAGTVISASAATGIFTSFIGGDYLGSAANCSVTFTVNGTEIAELPATYDPTSETDYYLAILDPAGPEETRLQELFELGNNTVASRWNCLNHPQANLTLTSTLQVIEQSASDFPGVAINQGDEFVNTKSVIIDLSFEGIPAQVAVSNDGGFSGSQTRIFTYTTNQISWQLRATTNERLPKTIYVKYKFREIDGSLSSWSTTFTDDIILDTTAPTLSIKSATRSLAAPTSRGVAKGTTRIKVSAKDDKSGVRSLQVNTARSSIGAYTRGFTSTLTLTQFKSAKKLYLRVRDGAGNWSSWKTVSIR